MTWRYTTHGLTLRSEIELPELRAAGETGPLDVSVRLEPVDVGAAMSGTQVSPNCWVGQQQLMVRIPAVASFAIGPDLVAVDPAPGAPADVVRRYLLGTGVGSLLHLRGALPLHASSAEIAGGCISIMGPTGVGKSTLLAALVGRGHRMISDDLTAVQGVAGAWVAPGYPSIKLSAESRDWLDLPATGLPAHGQAKTRVEAQLCTEPRRLRRLYLLRPVVGLEEPSILAIAPARAVKVVLAQVYRPGIGVALGRRGAQFQRVVELLRDVDVCLLRRPTDGTLIDTVAKTLEADCLDSSSDHTSRAPSTSR